MSTIDYQLNILRDTQMVQRRLLEKQFPYIDWARMPFSSYGDFFRLRGIIDDCGAVWTNAYGRSNEEADGQRNFLEDYSGNGRDIELFNFGYSKQSGYNGYVQDFRTWSDTDDSATINRNESTIEISNNTAGWVVALWNVSTNNTYINKQWTIDLHIISSTSSYISLLFFDNNSSQYKAIQLNEGRNVIQPLTDDEYAKTNFIRINCNAESHVVITQIPEYLGALVSDGVDDYGQCVKDFALPDDYTVVAMREILNDAGCLISKSIVNSGQAFILENIDTDGSKAAWSFGNYINVSTLPKLFSWLTKTSYNGNEFAPGTKKDSTDLPLTVFLEGGNSRYMAAALYSFGLFTRTLTAEELRIVENCMYAEWIAMTGKLEDIEYYDILDARFRSNEEDADKRNKWVGRLGKLHMTLNNYAYSQMSGWNGYPVNWLNWKSAVADNGGIMERRPNAIRVLNVGNVPSWALLSNETDTAELTSMKVRVSGLSDGKSLKFLSIKGDAQNAITTASSDGTYEISVDDADADYHAFILQGYVANEAADLTIELIPAYGGALVSDGVDDYAISDETIDEEIGGMVVMAEKISNPTTDYAYVFSSTQGLGTSEGNQIAGLISKSHDNFILGDPWTSIDKNIYNIYTLYRSPKSPNNKLMISNSDSNERGNAALYQLRLIKNQPTDIQLEAIKWQCRKEHDDYLIHMGWKEVE